MMLKHIADSSQNNRDERYYEAYLSHHKLSRRGLLRGLLGGSEQAIKQEKRQHNRPPFAAKESLFVEVCNGCGDCVDACPYGLIHLIEHKPVLNIDFSACDFCAKCAEVCHRHALHYAFPADTELRPEFAATCLLQRGQVCDECQQKCPQDAIVYSHNQLSVNQNCNGCGECKISCFVHAVTLITRYS
ncbi:ferredoxin-type protein NapF [Pasteurella canis]|uniref:ferredoxin-type protein NapF n=2 Tax=Pasteurella canis TaxID=753 RepID=UPI000D9046C9|nr:ferredoxin-type protein NapF [Pasteurella canis]SPY38454.1 ferredoxin-type NapF family protein [Pasteurella canis]